MDTTIYSDGTYLRNNPDWHSDDSPWKAGHLASMLERHAIKPASVCEIGCGAGGVLRSLAERLGPGVSCVGYDISPDAYRLCTGIQRENLEFRLGNLLDEPAHFDVVMAVDVFEHVEDCYGFLRKLRDKGRHKLFHIPLDLSVANLARPEKLMSLRRNVGHIHYFTRDTALALLRETGYRVIDHAYTAGAVELAPGGWKAQLMKLPRKLAYAVSPDFAARVLGGYSLLVLAE